MTRMTGPDCVVMCNLINTYIHTYIHAYIHTYIHTYIIYYKTKAILAFPVEESLVFNFFPARGCFP